MTLVVFIAEIFFPGFLVENPQLSLDSLDLIVRALGRWPRPLRSPFFGAPEITAWQRRYGLDGRASESDALLSGSRWKYMEYNWFISTHRNCVPSSIYCKRWFYYKFTVTMMYYHVYIHVYIYSALLRFLLDDHLSSQRRNLWPNRWPKNTVVYLARILRINDTFNASRNILKQSTERWCCW